VAVAANSARKVHVLLLDRNSLRVNGTHVGVLEKASHVRFGGLLKCGQGLGLEAKLVVHVQADGADKALEGGSREKHVEGLLVFLDFAEGNSTGLESSLFAFAFLHSALGGGRLLDGLVFGGDFAVHLVNSLGGLLSFGHF